VKKLIYDLDFEDLAALIKVWGQPEYRAKQIWQGLYQQFWSLADEFTTLPAALRRQLEASFTFGNLHLQIRHYSTDGETQKALFTLPDGNAIETVQMRYATRRTVCISTQAGCAMGCVFCATGQMGFRRHLSSGEIAEQVLFFARQLREEDERVTNVVLMGMGEPFHNYDESLAAVERLSHPEGFNLGARRFTISTVGLVPGIRRFTAEKRQTGLAISLHAADDELRASMLPVNQRFPIRDVLNACRDYVAQTGRRVTFEWALIRDVNDTREQANKLAELLKNMNCHVNVIPLNPTRGYKGQRSTREQVAAFRDILLAAGVSCTVRVRRGIDIQAGCGQLAEKASAQAQAA
jgi:23S rRNA (adenine2503-C2)-methyltransferase